MLENLLALVKENAGDSIINNPAIPNQHNDAAIQTATGGIIDQLKSFTLSNGIGDITKMFSGGDVANHPLTGNIKNNVSSELMKKFGVNASQATGIVESLIPKVMSSFVNKTNDVNDKSFNLQDVIGSITSNNSGGILNSIKNIFNK